MSTNFYVEDDPTCDNPAHTVELHVGKRSGGWKFGFQGYPEHNPPLTSFAAWRRFLVGRTVTDEYGKTLTADGFEAMVREWNDNPNNDICRVAYMKERYPDTVSNPDYHDDEGHDFTDGEFS